MNVMEGTPWVYLFVGRKSEASICAEFISIISKSLDCYVPVEIKSFRSLFHFLMEKAENRPFNLIIDEFQEFRTVNPAVFSEMQRIWDQGKDRSKMNLVLCGSVYSVMTRIFENAGEPLFGRATQRMHLKGFDVATLKQILRDHYPAYQPEDLLALFLITGGVPRYVELLVQNKAFTRQRMLEEVVNDNSLFLEEGRNVLIEEFGKDYANYFSILSLIASGKTARVEIESILEMQTGGFLDRLENEFNLIRKARPVMAKPSGRALKYSIDDNFLSFWFRFIYKFRSAVESGNLSYIRKVIDRDYDAYSGRILEKYFIEKLKTEKKYNLIGTWWSRGNESEIDIVAVDDAGRQVLFAEVKRNEENIDLELLKRKSDQLLPLFKGYQFDYRGFSLNDV